HHQPLVADRAVGDTLEDPRRPRIAAPFHALERQRGVKALRRHADADELLRRPAAIAPEPARLSGRRVVILARRTAPRAGAAPAATDLDHVRPRRADRRHPEEAVAAEIHE